MSGLDLGEAKAFEGRIVYCPVCCTNYHADELETEVECNNCDTKFEVDVSFQDPPVPDDEFTGAIIFCPLCSTKLDATAWGEGVYRCDADPEHTFKVVLDAEVVAEHAMFG